MSTPVEKPILDHTHGVANPDCGDPACRHALFLWRKLWAHERTTVGPRRIPAEEARNHIMVLLAAGWSVRGIGEAAGLSPTTISGLKRSEHHWINRHMANRILALRAAEQPARAAVDGFVPKDGTVRRLQALIALGWSASAISARVGEEPRFVYNRLYNRGPWVSQHVRDRVALLYAELSMRLPPETTMPERRAAARARKQAQNHGWQPPLAWDEDTIDDPAAKPVKTKAESLGYDEVAVTRFLEGREKPKRNWSRSEAVEIVRRMRKAGMSTFEIGEAGFKWERYKDEVAC